MRPILPILPIYSEQFRCIGPDCEDSCCVGWSVPIDRAAYEKYQTVPPGPLRTSLDANILLMPTRQESEIAKKEPAAPGLAADGTGAIAAVRMPPSQQCPFLTEQRLCGIQVEHGEGYLSQTCATYPRIVHWIDSLKDMTLALSCPEAARLVLLNPQLVAPVAPDDFLEMSRELAESGSAESKIPMRFFWPIRAFVVGLLQNRAYPLWQRLFLLGILCRRLDSIRRGELEDSDVPSLLRSMSIAIASGSLRAAMDTVPINLERQLDLVLRMGALCRDRAMVGPRFVECVNAFTQGIGNGPGATMKSLVSHYAAAHRQHYVPFFRLHPHILENYLLHTIFRRLFPFGHDKGKIPAVPEMADEFALLVAQFALMKGLLIGVAGFHKDAFSLDHVIHTVQSASKHFEHHPGFLTETRALLVEAGLNDASGLAILLRNQMACPSKTGLQTGCTPGASREARSPETSHGQSAHA